jgi:hypothetical protein
MTHPLLSACWRSGALLIKSVAVGILGGMVAGSGSFLVIQASQNGDWIQLAGWPFVAFYSIPIAAPFGAVSGALATGATEILLRSPLRASSRKAWMAVGGVSGLALGAACPFFLQLTGFNIKGPSALALFGGTGASAGACCGILLGWLGWAECRKRPGPNGVAPDA